MDRFALTQLSDEERLFKDSVLAFARERIAPKVAEMDRNNALDRCRPTGRKDQAPSGRTPVMPHSSWVIGSGSLIRKST